MIGVAIIACEVAFWTVLLSGLTARYVLQRPRLGAILLLAVPLTDALLLVVTTLHLSGGATADWTHGLAAIYLGFSVVMGPELIRRIDRRFARRFGSGAIAPATTHCAHDRLSAEWHLWARCVLACALAAAVLGALVLLAGEPDRTRALWASGGWFTQLGAVSALWLLFGPVWATVSHHLHRPRGAQ